MKLQCPNCQSEIPGEDINIQQNIAQCPKCEQVCRISDALATQEDNSHKENIIMPDGISVVPGLQLDILLHLRKISRLGTYYLFGIAFTAMPSLVLLLGSGDNTNEGLPIFVLAILSLFLFIGLMMLSYAITLTINKTYLTASSFELRIENRPINLGPWKNKAFKRDEIDQLFVERYAESRTNNRPNYAYKLLLVLKDDKHVVLIKGLKKAEYAFYIEHQIEKYLAIEDRRMMGEYVPGQRVLPFQLEQLPKFLQKLVKNRVER
jgi:hypothetical protein